MKPKLLKWRGPLLALSLLGLALTVLHRELRQYRYQDILLEFYRLPLSRLLLAALFTVLAYLVLTGYDALGLRYVGRRLPPGKIIFAAVTSYVISNNIGLSVLGASAIRLRLYVPGGIPPLEVLKIVLFRHGEHFYNCQGLRQFKEKFGPAWESRYLACPGAFSLPCVLRDIAALTVRTRSGRTGGS